MRSSTKTQAFFREFPFLRILEKEIPDAVTVKVRRAEDSLLDKKVPVIEIQKFINFYKEMTGYVLMFDKDDNLLYSLSRTNRKLPAVGYTVNMNFLIGPTFVFLAVVSAVFVLVSEGMEWKNWLTNTFASLVPLFVALAISIRLWVRSKWDDCHNETIGQTLKKLGAKAHEVFYVAIYDGWDKEDEDDGYGPRLTLYKTPKNYSLGEWAEFQRQLAQKDFRSAVDQIDASGSSLALLARTLISKRAVLNDNGVCSICSQETGAGNFCRHCGSTFLNPDEIRVE